MNTFDAMPRESFRWDSCIFDVSTMLTDIRNGRLAPLALDWPVQAVRAYFECFLDPRANFPRPPLLVDLAYADSLPIERLQDPIILVHVGDRGLVAYEEPDDVPHHVVADGNHRIARAASQGVGLRSLVLSRIQTEPYESMLGDVEA